MAEPIFESITRRQLDDARTAIVELAAMVLELDHDPLDDPAAYVTSPQARDAVRMALSAAGGSAPSSDRSTVTVEDLRDQLLTDGVRLEREAVTMAGGPDVQNAMQGRALGLQQAGLRLSDLLHRSRLAATGS